MEIIEVPCANCQNMLLIQKDHQRKQMFCTLGCMSSFKEGGSSQNKRY